MENREYRVVCMLNALERRLCEMQGVDASPSVALNLLEAQARSIAMQTADADRRYLRDRLEYMLEAYFGGIDPEGARRLVAQAMSSAGGGTRKGARRSSAADGASDRRERRRRDARAQEAVR